MQVITTSFWSLQFVNPNSTFVALWHFAQEHVEHRWAKACAGHIWAAGLASPWWGKSPFIRDMRWVVTLCCKRAAIDAWQSNPDIQYIYILILHIYIYIHICTCIKDVSRDVIDSFWKCFGVKIPPPKQHREGAPLNPGCLSLHALLILACWPTGEFDNRIIHMFMNPLQNIDLYPRYI